jgi:outer membrane lipoprotein-sorting protein
MKLSYKTTFFYLFLLGITNLSIAQNVDEIINSYYETIGGKNWNSVNGMRMTANVDQGGMSIPLEIVGMKDGRSFTKITFMGNTMTMAAFDGKKSWTTNFMTMQPEESPAEDSENAIRSSKEFPNALVSYKNLGYTATLLGSEKVEGTDCHKIKLEKKSMLVDGKEIPNVEYYYLDKENNVPVLVETEISSGEMKGQISQTKFSDYQEVSGVYFPFSTTQGLKDGQSQTIQFEKIEVNPTVDDSMFAFPKK